MGEQDNQAKQAADAQSFPGGPSQRQKAGQEGGQQKEEQHVGRRDIDARRAVDDEIGIGQILEILPDGQPLHGQDQFMSSGLGKNPQYQCHGSNPERAVERDQEDDQPEAAVGKQADGLSESLVDQAPESREKTGRDQKKQGIIAFQKEDSKRCEKNSGEPRPAATRRKQF